MNDSGRPMRFGIASEVLEVFPNYCVGVVVASGLSSGKAALETDPALEQAAAGLKETLAGQPVDQNARIRVWMDAFRRAGIDPFAFPPSVESLARRVVDGDGPPRVNPVVDAANAVSLRYLLPVGAHDLDRLRGDFWVRYSRTGDTFTPLGQTEKVEVPPSEIVYADDQAARTRRWVWRMGDSGKVTPASRAVFFPIDGFVGATDEAVREAVQALAATLHQTFGAETFTAFVDRDQPVVELPVPLKTGPDPIEDLLDRGFAEIIGREELERRLRAGQSIRIYLGVDPTSPIIHVGHAVALRKLRKFQDLGAKIVLLIGDFTGRIGDPTGKDAARVQLTHEQVLENARSYVEQANTVLDVNSPTNPVEVRYNGDWWDRMTSKDMILLAAHFTAQQMLQRDMFQKRLDENKPIGLHEFLYPLLQGYDSVAMEVDAEIGGTDQTFNMLAGRTLVRALQDREKFVLTVPLLEGTDGRKMSKSYNNVIGVAEPAYAMYGKLMSLKDELIPRYFELLTDMPLREIATMPDQIQRGTVNPMALKKRLAFEITRQFHDAEAAREAQERFEREVQHKEIPAEIPEVALPHEGDWLLVDLLVATNLATSKSDAKRLIEGGSAQIDGEKVSDPRATIAVRPGLILRGRRRQYVRLALPATVSGSTR